MHYFVKEDLCLHYLWIDNKKPRTFLFINSLGTDFRIWNDVVETLKQHGNILLFDKRGHGSSDTGTHGVAMSDYMEDALALLNHLSINTCVVVGLSIGGMIAQLMAYHHPDRIDKLVLCDTRSKIADPAFWNGRIKQIETDGLTSISAGVMERWFPESFRKQFPERILFYRKMVERCSQQGYIHACAAIRDADLTSTTKKIKSKTLCIVGSEDLSTTPAQVEELSSFIEGSTCVQIKGSAHLPCIDNPRIVSSLILDFINS